jgi:hypothetical protein
MITEASSSASPEVENWRERHRAAMHKTVRKELPFRINDVEKALARHSRELFALPGKHLEERKEWITP